MFIAMILKSRRKEDAVEAWEGKARGTRYLVARDAVGSRSWALLPWSALGAACGAVEEILLLPLGSGVVADSMKKVA